MKKKKNEKFKVLGISKLFDIVLKIAGIIIGAILGAGLVLHININANDNHSTYVTNNVVNNSSPASIIIRESNTLEKNTKEEKNIDSTENLLRKVETLANRNLTYEDLDSTIDENGFQEGCKLLWLTRNYYYAQGGRPYGGELGEFYNRYDWYSPYNEGLDDKTITQKLGDREKHNVNLIYAWEHENDSPYKIP